MRLKAELLFDCHDGRLDRVIWKYARLLSLDVRVYCAFSASQVVIFLSLLRLVDGFPIPASDVPNLFRAEVISASAQVLDIPGANGH